MEPDESGKVRRKGRGEREEERRKKQGMMGRNVNGGCFIVVITFISWYMLDVYIWRFGVTINASSPSHSILALDPATTSV